jgi:hypothetical protein
MRLREISGGFWFTKVLLSKPIGLSLFSYLNVKKSKMNKIYFLLLIVCLNGKMQAQLYNNGGTISISNNATLHVGGTFTNANNGVIANNGTLNLTGNLVNNQSMSAANGGTLTFAGSSTQTVSGTDSYLAKNVRVNNATGVTLSKSLRADGEVAFQSGIITASSSTEPLVFSANGTVSTTNAPSNTSHVNGFVTKEGTGAFTYPVGDGTRYQPVGTTLTANTMGMRVKYNATDAGTATLTGNLMSYNTLEHWDLAPLSTATGTVTITWDDYKNPNIADVSKLVVAHKVGSNWVNETAASQTGSTAAGSVTSQAISTWSPFALGTISAVLPVELLSFTGKNTEGGNLLMWITAGESNNKGFNVEWIMDNGQWGTLGFVKAQGKAETYDFMHKNPSSVSYYRLRQIDNDGKETLSKIISITAAAETRRALSLHPNPATDVLTVEFTKGIGATEKATTFEIINFFGQIILRGPLNQSVDVAALPSGTYIVRLSQLPLSLDGGGLEQVKFVKQ